ncbi:MAG: phosphoribosylformylglycinamidine cyclo-ligase [Spirochaetaceae bacterium]|nr:phosphoribosylformylglycinamidine cyclo-ligase [Spirochaetaceae bacterium]
MDYKEAGVNIEEGYRAVEKYRNLAGETLGELRGAVLNGIGSFAGMLSLKDLIAGTGSAPGMEDPVLVSGADGVGTKLDIAFRMNRYDTVGIDCVAMCVNDILCHGARPLFFLDYLACGKLNAETAAALVTGVAAGCRESGCVLLGGETAEMPGFYSEGTYDMAGFALGIVDRKNIVDGRAIREGDALVGMASSGPHSNGYSLIRRIIPNLNEDFQGMPIGSALLEPTRLYIRPVRALMEQIPLHGMAHITGGGFYENIPRMFSPPGAFDALIKDGAWDIPQIFIRIAAGAGDLALPGTAGTEPAEKEKARGTMQKDGAAGHRAVFDGPVHRLLFNTFNMGIGFVIAVDPGDVPRTLDFLNDQGYPAWEIGAVERGTGKVRFVP